MRAQLLKIAVLPVILLPLLMMGGCVIIEATTQPSGDPSFFRDKKVSLSSVIFMEKDLLTKKINLDSTEEEIKEEVYATLRGNLSKKGLLAQRGMSNSFEMDVRMHYKNWTWVGYIPGRASSGGQVLVVQGIFKKEDDKEAIKLDIMGNTGTLVSRNLLVTNVVDDLVAGIEKILKEGVNVGKSP